MYCLTVEEIEAITKDVENEGINFSHLSIDLIDHICCDIESKVNQGISFTEAYSQVKQKFDIKGLRHIQQDTLMLIDKNYRIMKNSMKTIGVVALAIMAFSALFKIMHWPFAGPMLVLSFFLIACVFFPALLYVMYRDVNQKQQAFLYIVAFLSGLVFLAGVLFKIMHWPYAQLLFFPGLALIAYVMIPLIIASRIKKLAVNKSVFLTGLISLIIILTGLICKINHWPGATILLDFGSVVLVFLFIPLYYFKEVRNSEKLRLDFIFGIIALTYFIIFTFLLTMSGNKSLQIDLNYQVKSYHENMLFLNNENNEMLKQTNHKLALQLSKQTDLLDQEIEEIKLQIIQMQYNVSKEDAKVMAKNNVYIDDNNASVNYALERSGSRSSLLELKKNFEEFNRIYSTLFKDSLKQESTINQLFNVENKFIKPEQRTMPWEEYCFMDCTPAAALNILSFWQYNLRLTENVALSELIYNSKNN